MREIAHIDTLSFSESWSEESYLEMNKNKSYLFLQEEIDGKLAGFILLMDVVDAIEIIRVAVHPDYRGRGIGDTLVKRALEESIKKGMENIFLEVRESNTKALKLYEKNGFEQCGVRKNYYSNPKENGVIMIKRIV
jgi:[ribosomal protein S18]-alanine N-acetyltransferase